MRKEAVSPIRGNRNNRSGPVPNYGKKSRGTIQEDSGSEERESDGEDSVYARRTVDKSNSHKESKSSHRASVDHHRDHSNTTPENSSGRHYKDFIDEDCNEHSQSQRRSIEKYSKVHIRSHNSQVSGRDSQNDCWNTKETDVELDSQALLEERVVEAVNDRVDTRFAEFEKKMFKMVDDALASVRDAGSRLTGAGSQQTDSFTLTQTQSFVLGSFTRNKIFRIIKVFDEITLAKEGKTIVEKCKNVTGITGPTTKSMSDKIMAKVRWYHNKRKGHVRGKLRELVTCKYCCRVAVVVLKNTN